MDSPNDYWKTAAGLTSVVMVLFKVAVQEDESWRTHLSSEIRASLEKHLSRFARTREAMRGLHPPQAEPPATAEMS
jgi:hypothetical protein